MKREKGIQQKTRHEEEVIQDALRDFELEFILRSLHRREITPRAAGDLLLALLDYLSEPPRVRRAE